MRASVDRLTARILRTRPDAERQQFCDTHSFSIRLTFVSRKHRIETCVLGTANVQTTFVRSPALDISIRTDAEFSLVIAGIICRRKISAEP
jgi:hypothetical protein